MFGKKKKFSTARFVERAIELDVLHLFTHMPLTAAISRISTLVTQPNREQTSASAYGVFHDNYGQGQPLLPVEIEFDFRASDTDKPGWGEIWNNALRGERPSYRARVIVADPAARLFNAAVKAAEHAAISGHQFLHLVFHRERKVPYHVKTDQAEMKARTDDLAALMRRIDAGDEDAEMPHLEWDTLSIEDSIYLKGPSWSHAWVDGVLERPMFHNRDAAKWRGQPWRQ